MIFSNSFKRELGRVSSHSVGNLPQRSRTRRDPFEGDPFKVQSLNFHYADKPSFLPVSNRGKAPFARDKLPEVKNLYYNHDHSIPKRDKENIPRRGGQSSASAYASKVLRSQKHLSAATSSTSKELASDSVESGLALRKSHTRTFISQPGMSALCSSSGYTQSVCTKRPLKQNNTSTIPHSSANVPIVNSAGCHITIKINGVPRNRVQIKKSQGNVEINLTKLKKPKKPQPPQGPFDLKPSRSYVIHRNVTSPEVKNDTSSTIKRSVTPEVVRESSTHSMVPHCEQSRTRSRSTSSVETYKSSSKMQQNSVNMRKSSSTLNKQAVLLERILSHNPIVVKSRMREPSSKSRLTSNPISSFNRG